MEMAPTSRAVFWAGGKSFRGAEILVRVLINWHLNVRKAPPHPLPLSLGGRGRGRQKGAAGEPALSLDGDRRTISCSSSPLEGEGVRGTFFGGSPIKSPLCPGPEIPEGTRALWALVTSSTPNGTSRECLRAASIGGSSCPWTFFRWTPKKAPFFSAPKKPKKSSIRKSAKSAKIGKFA